MNFENVFDRSGDKNFSHEFLSLLRENVNLLSPSWHPLGFIHCLLHKAESGETIRLHFWSKNISHPSEQSDKIHDHKFDIRSRVLFGALVNIRYEFIGSDGGDSVVCRVRYNENGSEMVGSDSFGCVLIKRSEEIFSPGDYFVDRFKLHETRLLSDQALTLVKTGIAADYDPRVVFHRGREFPSERSKILIDRAAWLDLIRPCLEQI